MKEKELTKGEIERRLRNALVVVPRDKDYQGIYFDDKGVKVEITRDYAVISTNYHRHVFAAITAQGYSRPYLYTKRFLDIALANDCLVRDEKGNVTRSYGKLAAILKEKEDQMEYTLFWYYDLWLNNIFHPLYSIGESEAESFLVYEQFLHNTARNQIIFSEKIGDMTNTDFVKGVCENMEKYMEGVEPRVVFKKMTDEEREQAEIAALAEHETEKTLEQQANNDGK